MTFEEWWDKTLDVGYTSAKKLARDAWEAATKAEHKDAATTAIYRDVRNSEWVMVKAG